MFVAVRSSFQKKNFVGVKPIVEVVAIVVLVLVLTLDATFSVPITTSLEPPPPVYVPVTEKILL